MTVNSALWGLAAALAFGIADFCGRFTGRALGPASALLGLMLVGALALTLNAPSQGWHLALDWPLIWSGLAAMAAPLAFYRAMTLASLSLVMPIAAAYPALIVPVSVVTGALPGALEWVGMGLTGAGAIVVARTASEDSDISLAADPANRSRAVAYAALASTLFAAALLTGQFAAARHDPGTALWVGRLLGAGESKDGKEFNPRAFQVFGPKLVAMRKHFDDTALESRFLTETTGGQPLREDIPVNLPEEQRWEALRLRNKLLLFRFRNYFLFDGATPFLASGFEARLNQIFSPLAALMENGKARDALMAFAQESNEALQAERDASLEAQVLTVIRLLAETASVTGVPIKKITALYNRTFGKEYGRPVTPKWMGGIIRKRLNLKTHKNHGIFVLGPAEQAKLTLLYERYGVRDEDVEVLANTPGALTGELHLERSHAGDFRDMKDIPTLPTIN